MRITIQANSINEKDFREIINFFHSHIIGQRFNRLDYKISIDEIVVGKGTGSRGTDVKYYIADIWLHESRYTKFDKEFFIYFFTNVLKYNRMSINLFIMNSNFETIYRQDNNSRKVLQVMMYDDK